MLFYVIGEWKQPASLPPEQLQKRRVKTYEMFIDYQKQGKFLGSGMLATGKAACAIMNVDSNEEAYTVVSRMPLYPFLEWQIVPSTSPEFALETAQRALEASRSTK